MYHLWRTSFPCRAIKILISFMYAFSLVACLSAVNTDYGSPTPIATRQVKSTEFSLKEYWRLSEPPIIISENFYTNGEQLIYVGYSAPEIQLNVVNARNGALIWKTDPLPYNGDAVIADTKRIYLLMGSSIHSYNLYSGELEWKVTGLPMHTIYNMYVDGNKLIVYSMENSNGNNTIGIVRTYDSKSGLLENTDNVAFSENATFIFNTSTNNYWSNSNNYWADSKYIWSVDNRTSLAQWSAPVTGRIQGDPLLIGNKFIFASDLFSDVIALDSKTGKKIWQYDKKIVSNIAADSGILYAIREDAALVAIDTSTDNEIGYLEISPSFTEESPGSRSISYYVTAAKGIVVVYFGDSQEIISFSK